VNVGQKLAHPSWGPCLKSHHRIASDSVDPPHPLGPHPRGRYYGGTRPGNCDLFASSEVSSPAKPDPSSPIVAVLQLLICGLVYGTLSCQKTLIPSLASPSATPGDVAPPFGRHDRRDRRIADVVSNAAHGRGP
jgi:hypothetical protein